MQSSNHIGKIVREHARAVEDSKAPKHKRKKGSAKSSSFTSVPKHRLFVPMVTVWGGLLLALITAVLPDQVIAQASSLTGVYLPLIVIRLTLATGIGLIGALLGYIVSSALSSNARFNDGDGVLVSAFKSRDLQPIDPVADLGSESFDAPLTQPSAEELAEPAEFSELPELNTDLGADSDVREPTLGELEKRGFEMEAPEDLGKDNDESRDTTWAFTRKHFKDALIETCEGATCEAATGVDDDAPVAGRAQPQARKTEPVKNTNTPRAPQAPRSNAWETHRPRTMDLDEFGSLPGRNAVWVEEDAQPAPRAGAPDKVENPQDALSKLRQQPADDLSLVEMIERFAGALHDHQAQERARLAEGEVAREAALAEALKALALFTEKGFDQGLRQQPDDSEIVQTEDELRRALARLQDMRGAA